MQKIFSTILIILFLGLVGLFLYKTINKPSIVSASLSNQTQGSSSLAGLDDVSKEALHTIIRDYIISHPEDIMKSLEVLQNRKMEESAKQVETYIKDNLNDIENGGAPPMMGNENGDIRIVVFYDYNCSFCKKGNDHINKLIKSDNKVKIILRPLPILGENSDYIAKAMLVINKISHDKFIDIHNHLMNMNIITNDALKQIIKSHDIDLSIVENEISSYSINEIIKKNFDLAKNMGIKGAPSYVINGYYAPGLLTEDKFKEIIKELRQ